MERTVGNADRIIRVVLAGGAVAGAGALGFSGAWAIVLLVMAGVLLLTGASGFCPAYSAFGVDTLHRTDAAQRHFGPFHRHRLA